MNKDAEQVPDGHVFREVVFQPMIGIDLVDIPSAGPSSGYVSVALEVVQNPVYRPLGDADGRGHLPRGALRILRDVQKYKSMVREESPFLHPRIPCTAR